ncbi:HEAT repeat domain-containing protein [Candidatus Methanoperedens nitratireducens]|uniref:Putative Microtubule-severing ATPase n=1 Tax=Candidatus Methanoperedens nitratireducens TaxID=1392998 RepID=A0A284VR25_9EURY|nr:HEAT repeat domain-containing protein [Candidatus Methanoperedens nitroreducens]SNQ61740.1 putative Microtubule-severing ATPase [Candidatus Methanoperedens nitroreducens]
MSLDDIKNLSDKLEEKKKKYTAIKEEDFEKDILRLITSTPVTWEDIAGLDNAKKTINETVKYSQMKGIPDAIKPWKGVLLFGPPGTGKTLFAAATASTLKATFFNVKPGDLLSKNYGESSKNISALYNVARKRAPSIIFLDEFDSIGSKRDDIFEASRRVLSTLLSEMDGLHNKKSSRYILTMAATNTPWDLDSAALNRFEKRFYVPLPDTQTVMEIIKMNTQGVELDGNILNIAQTCVLKLFAGRDVAALCNEAVRIMIREENGPEVNKPKMRPLTRSDFRKSFPKIKGTITAREIRKYEDWAEKNGTDSYNGGYAEHRYDNVSEIFRKALSEKVSERKEAAYEIGKNFTAFPDKKQSTKILLDLTKDNNSGVRRNAVEAIGSAFYHLTDKGQAINDLHALTKDEKWEVRSAAAKAISSAFIHITDRGRAKNDLFALIKDEKWEVRSAAAKGIGSVYNHFAYRGREAKDLFDLTKHEKWEVRSAIAEAIGSAFKYLTDLDQATEVLLKLAKDENSFVRRNAAEAIGSSFSDLTNKNKNRATKALLTLAKDDDSFVRRNAAEAIGLSFSHVTDKVRAWNDLLVLIKRDDRFVLIGAAYALGSAFPHVTDKDQATEALLALINDKDANVRSVAAETFGSVFPYIADKYQATESLLALTKDEKSIVRAYANHSLGRAYVFRATESKDKEDFRKELEQALQFFEKSSREETHSQPAGFCLPFYRSFYMLTFKKEEAKAEVQKYLEEAKYAVEGSHSKEKLLEAVKNLGNALKEVQKEQDFNDLRCDLKAYRNYCERAAEILDEVEGKAPRTAQLVRMGLPIIDERIKGMLAGIEIKTKTLCGQTKGTQLIKFGEEIYGQGKNLPRIGDPIKLDIKINEMRNTLSMLCGRLIEEDIIEELKILNKINDEQYIVNKVEMINSVLQNILIKVKPKTRL